MREGAFNHSATPGLLSSFLGAALRAVLLSVRVNGSAISAHDETFAQCISLH